MSTVIVRALVRPLGFLMLGLSLFLLLRGHHEPGGGFAGGLLAGAALALRRLAGAGPVRARARAGAAVLAAGMLIAVGYGLVGLVLGDAFLGSRVWRLGVPIVGDLKITASLVFDLGVYVVVVTVVAIFLETLEGDGWRAP